MQGLVVFVIAFFVHYVGVVFVAHAEWPHYTPFIIVEWGFVIWLMRSRVKRRQEGVDVADGGESR